MGNRLGVLVLVLIGTAAAGEAAAPVGFIAAGNVGTITPAGTRTPLRVSGGQFLFAGDTLSSGEGPIPFYFCPPGSPDVRFSYTLRGTVTLGTSPPDLKGVPVDVCAVPEVEGEPEVATLPPLRELLPARAAREELAARVGALQAGQRGPLELLLKGDLNDSRIRLALAAGLEKAGLARDAAEQYAEVLEQWKYEPRLHRLIRDLVEAPASRAIVHPSPAEPKAATKGKTYALVVGISQYEQANIPKLRFADADARQFAEYLRTPRGGADEVKVLTDAEATSGAIRNCFNELSTKAGRNDTVILLIAAHGDMIRNTPFVITHRADPQDLGINGFPMAEIQKWALAGKRPFQRAMVFLDVCHAGHAAQFQTPSDAAGPSGEYLMLLATHQGKDAYAYEDEVFGKGHGVFTYFLLRGLNTNEAKSPLGNFVGAGNLSQYVLTNVVTATSGLQMPTTVLGLSLNAAVADLDKGGITPFDDTPLSRLRLNPESLKIAGGRRGQPAPKSPPARGVRPQGSPELVRRIQLENEGEEILLRYLKGDEVPQSAEEFRLCQQIFESALALQPGSPYLEARRSFCEGRAAVFEQAYARATGLLARSIRLDPGAAYGYNALGIAWLQQNQFGLATAAFEDAIQRAPQWAYPRHNLALTHMQLGNYEAAVRDTKEAMLLAPAYFYLPYSLGLLYQRTNRLDQAAAMYLAASRMAKERAEPYNGLGSVEMLRGKWTAAERYFRTALAQNDQLPPAVMAGRHNLGLVLARRQKTRAEALSLWRQNGDYVPSRLGLAEDAEARARNGGWRDQSLIREAIEAYRSAVGAAPRYVPARRSLAELLERAQQQPEAVREYLSVLELAPGDTLALERLGNLYLSAERWSEACQAFDSALAGPVDGRAAKRLQSARAKCAGHRP